MHSSILFFEDYPFDSENQLFRTLLKRDLKGMDVEVFDEKTVHGFEEVVQRLSFDVVVLDIMAQAPRAFTWNSTKNRAPSALVGVELLRRCRHGDYGRQYTTLPIYMRTARGEAPIRRLCISEGATAFFRVGMDDMKLIQAIKEHLMHISQPMPAKNG